MSVVFAGLMIMMSTVVVGAAAFTVTLWRAGEHSEALYVGVGTLGATVAMIGLLVQTFLR